MYPESDLLPISALQHLLFCERQCALIHNERQWAENRYTVEGAHLHKKAHDGRDEWRGNTHIVRRLSIRSFRLGVVGQTDVVELEYPAGTAPSRQVPPPSAAGHSTTPRPGPPPWVRVNPIEYKRGRPKKNDTDRVQLCAQAICLEEMLAISIPAGDLFYGKRQRRTHVEFDDALRAATEKAALRLHEMIAAGETPPAVRDARCDACSLIDFCLPEVTQASRSASRFVGRQFAGHLRGGVPATDPFDLSADAATFGPPSGSPPPGSPP